MTPDRSGPEPLDGSRSPAGCAFCGIAAGRRPGHVLVREETVLAILSLEGHPLIMPVEHMPGLDDLDDRTGAALMRVASRVARALRAETGCEGINLVLSDGAAAGQDVFHLHLHVKPRWIDDGVVLAWDTATIAPGERERLAVALAARLG